MTRKAVLFDLDGTLINSMPVTLKAFLLGAAAGGRPNMTPQEIMKYFGPSEYEIYLRALDSEAQAKAAYEVYRQELKSRLSEAPLHDEISELLEKLRTHSVPCGIVTGRSLEMTEVLLAHHQIKSYFQTVVSDDEVENHKPAPDGILLACQRMKLDPKNTLYVGDAVMDIGAAKAAGSTSVAAVWDKIFPRDSLEKQKPDYFAETPMEVWGILAA